MKWNKWICWLKYAWRSIPTLISSGFPTSGCDWQDVEYRKGCDVTISKCETCGKVEILWSGGYKVENR